MTAPAIQVEQVSKRFGEDVVALADVSLALAPGELVALVGPSGSGKSTLLDVIGGLQAPDAGRVVLGEDVISDLGERDRSRLRRRAVGFIFQHLNLLEELTAAENIALPLRLNGVPKAERAARVAALLERLGLGNRGNAFPATLSGGERQRVACARAVAHRPRLVLADEPTAHLDSARGDDLMAFLRELCRDERVALLVATHDPRVSARADRTLHLHDGRLKPA